MFIYDINLQYVCVGFYENFRIVMISYVSGNDSLLSVSDVLVPQISSGQCSNVALSLFLIKKNKN